MTQTDPSTTPPASRRAKPLAVSAHHFVDDGSIPNHPTLPLVLYPQVVTFPATDPAAVAEQILRGHGWGGTWRNGIYRFHHYHSTAHEVLLICRGEARVQFGGAAGTIVTVQAGDGVVIPAGVGHYNLGDSGDLLVVGGYPPRQRPDLCDGRAGERPQVIENIQRVPLPTTDPFYGEAGPLHDHWQIPSRK